MVNVSMARGASLAGGLILLFAAACSSSNGDSSNNSTSGGACTGDITGCSVGSLSSAQRDEECSLILASISDPPGTKYECKSGPNMGAFLAVSTKTDCAAQSFPASCKITVGEVIDCYKSAKDDVCGAFAMGGACAYLADPATLMECGAQ